MGRVILAAQARALRNDWLGTIAVIIDILRDIAHGESRMLKILNRVQRLSNESVFLKSGVGREELKRLLLTSIARW